VALIYLVFEHAKSRANQRGFFVALRPLRRAITAHHGII
jgi:hypothetical protein